MNSYFPELCYSQYRLSDTNTQKRIHAMAQQDLSAAGLFKSDAQLASVDKKWAEPVSEEHIAKAKAGLEGKKFIVHVVGNKAEALTTIVGLIPDGASVHNAGSTTLSEVGFTEYAKKDTKWNNLHAKILAETDQAKAGQLRQQAILADYYLTSASAVSETGDIVACDLTGTRVGAFHQGAGHLVVVVGSQKIVPTLAVALKRQSEYCLPLESARCRIVYKVPGSSINNIAVVSGANPWGAPGRVIVIIVKEALGF